MTAIYIIIYKALLFKVLTLFDKYIDKKNKKKIFKPLADSKKSSTFASR